VPAFFYATIIILDCEYCTKKAKLFVKKQLEYYHILLFKMSKNEYKKPIVGSNLLSF